MKYNNRTFRELQVLELNDMGFSQKEIARIIGVSKITVWNICKKLGIHIYRKLNHADMEEIKQMWEAGVTIGEIARRKNVSPLTVYNVTRKLNLKRRQKNIVQKRQDRERIKGVIERIVNERGVIDKEELWEKLKKEGIEVNRVTFLKYLRQIEGICCAEIKIGGIQGSHKYRSNQLFNGLSARTVIYREGDNRIVGYVGSKVIPPETVGQCRALFSHLKKCFGEEVARKIIEYTGYRYSPSYRKRGFK